MVIGTNPHRGSAQLDSGSAQLIETLERLRLISGMPPNDWYEILEVRWQDYYLFRNGRMQLSEKAFERLARHFNLDLHSLLSGKVDFTDLACSFSHSGEDLPERYARAAFGRRRTSSTSLDFITANHGWRLRFDLLKHFEISELSMKDPFAPISMQFITDMTDYLHRRNFREQDFFTMGMYSYIGNRGTLVARLLSEARTSLEAFELFFGDCMRLFERNCIYNIVKTAKDGLLVEVISDPHVAAEVGVRHLGNEHVCELKAGMFAIVPRYLNQPNAHVREVSCVHRGDSTCLYKIDLPQEIEHHLIQPYAN